MSRSSCLSQNSQCARLITTVSKAEEQFHQHSHIQQDFIQVIRLFNAIIAERLNFFQFYFECGILLLFSMNSSQNAPVAPSYAKLILSCGPRHNLSSIPLLIGYNCFFLNIYIHAQTQSEVSQHSPAPENELLPPSLFPSQDAHAINNFLHKGSPRILTRVADKLPFLLKSECFGSTNSRENHSISSVGCLFPQNLNLILIG